MIIIITNKEDITVDYIVRAFRKDNIDYYRFNTEDFFDTVDVEIDITDDIYLLYDKVKHRVVDLNSVTAVYYRRPGIPELKNVSGVTEKEIYYLKKEALSVLDGIYKKLESCFWINNVYRIREAENKLFQLELAKEIGFSIPDTVLTNRISYVNEFVSDKATDFIIKPVRSGNIDPKKANDIIFTSSVTADEITEENVAVFPVYLQNEIKKKADLRCIVVGSYVFTAEILSQEDEDGIIDWRRSKRLLTHQNYNLPSEIKGKCIEITQRLGLVYSAIDLVLDRNDNIIFLECNPNGQWAWIENRIGTPISTTIEGMLIDGCIS